MFQFLHSKTAISFNILWYFRYFVGTNDILVGSHVPTKLRKKSIAGGGGGQRHHVFSCLGSTGNTGNPR